VDYNVNGPDMDYEPGLQVKLKNVAGRQNGMEGRIVGKSGSRYRVRLENNNLVEVAGRNLQQVVEGAVLHNLQSRPELNGRKVRLVSFDPQRGKYQGYLSGSRQPQLIRPQNVILPDETPVRLAGLMRNVQMNGETATVVSFSSDESKYLIDLGGRTTKIAMRNVFAG